MKIPREDEMFRSLLWHLAQLGLHSWQLYTPVTLYSQGNSLVLICVTVGVGPQGE